MTSIRSTFWTTAAAVVLFIGFSCLGCVVFASHWATTPDAEKLTFNRIAFSLTGAGIAQLAIGVLGVLVVTTEYSSGMIRATFAAVPRRSRVLAAKGLVFFAFAAVVGVVTSFVSFFCGQAILNTYSGPKTGSNSVIADHTTLSSPGALRAVIGAGLFLAGVGLLGLSLGAMLRRSTGAITALVGLLFVLPTVVLLLPNSIQKPVEKYMPASAGGAIYHVATHLPAGVTSDSNILSPAVGFVVLVAYAAAALALAAFLVNRRDA